MVYMVRGCVHAFLLVLFLLSTVVYANDNGNMPVVSAPSLSITSFSQSEEPVFLASGMVGSSESDQVIQATNKIVQGDTVFTGENHLEVSSALGTAGSIAWWQSGNTNPAAPDAVLPVTTPQSFFIDPAYFSLKSGDWFQWVDNQKGPLAFRVADPSLYLRIWDVTVDEDVTGTVIPMGNLGTFIIESNLYSIVNRTGYSPADSQIKINMTNPSGKKYSFLVGPGGVEHPLTKLQVDSPLWYWIGLDSDHTHPSPHDGWNTTELYLNGTKIYLPGVYTVRAECNVNSMKDTYKAPDGSDYTNKTVSMVHTVELIDDTVSLTAEPSLVVPGEPFETVITGLPHTEYYLWTKGTGSMSGQPGDQPPLIVPIQQNVLHDAPAGLFAIGDYVFSGGDGKTIRDDVPHDSIYNGTQFYGLVKLDSTGSRTVLWNTTDTKPGSYTLAVQRKTSAGYVGDTCMLSVNDEKQISIQAAGTGPFYKGSVVSLSGLNKITDITYLFLSGPGLPAAGGSLLSPLTPVQSDIPATFDSALVSESDTWMFSWTIPHTIPETGIYTLYAVSEPKNLTDIGEAVFASLPIQISSGNSSSLNLVSGWNFISTPDVLANGHNTMAIFSGVNASGHSIFTYNGSTSSWITLKAEDLFSPLQGIWMYSVSPTEIPLVIDNNTVVPRALAKGWNSIGIISPDRTAGIVLQPLDSLWSYLVGYNAPVQQYAEPLVAGDPAVNTTTVHTKEGYWLYLKDNATFSG